MGKKKRGHPDIEEVLERPWCYYCERDFEDLKLLISHQKAKHFKCDRCHRRLNTAGGLSVHLNQVHKETLQQVENALPNRQGLEVEIFGMEGIPADILEQHRNRIIQTFYQAQESRRIATGNPVPGGQGSQPPRKKIKYESKEELVSRLAEWREKRRADKEAIAKGEPVGGQYNEQYQPQQQPQQQQQGHEPSPYGYPAGGNLPARPPGGGAPAGLPPRPEGQAWNTAAAPSDEIDKMIRMAEAGIKPPGKADEGAGDEGDKKAGKKEKKGRLFYDDPDTSPEEKMARMPRYAVAGAA
ncbi:hypothetical protein JDV02_008820 [Purpureocillium takamizusanense]|uniref:RING-6 like protein n=1 Tax=Purpureocillium takamizusanense TaxID=2060973 RepID=A0A9Q8QMT1_9HYPO|nr:uncharacterized protein JDV02_008820 [Purpureocillium takamizusanense]UNI22978.1 hypothetical protein JDV02_008820 [Purpureocillium takamizusanense]